MSEAKLVQAPAPIKTLVDSDGNEFHVMEKLGEGGQGIVYTTDDPTLAIKQPFRNGQIDTSRDFNLLFENIRHLPLPKNLHITSPIAILKNEPGFVMRLMAGRMSLVQYDTNDYDAYGLTGATKARLQILAATASTLSRLQAAGLVYVDISANNVYVDKDDKTSVWLIDPDNLRFEVEGHGSAFYTPGYGAPEVVRGEDGSRPTSDVWAMTVLTYRLLTMLEPFRGRLVEENTTEDTWETSSDAASDNPESRAYAGYLPYVDDPTDDSNRAEKDGVPMGLPRDWVFTPELHRLIDQTFCAGRTQPWRRPSMLSFAKALQAASDLSVVCKVCGRSFYHGQFDVCPWCDAKMPYYCVATSHIGYRMVLQGASNSRYKLPQRMFKPFYPETHASTEYEVQIDLNGKECLPVRGTRPFPRGLTFDFVGGTDGV